MNQNLKNVRILLIGNYPPDGQRSMERFAGLLYQVLKDEGIFVDLIRPSILLGRIFPKASKFSKWAGYVDKLLLFPLTLLFKKKSYDLVHICDHSNSHYLLVLDRKKTLVTCHDCLAIRAAREEFEQIQIGCFGKVLQKYILGGLRMARWIACDSESSRKDVLRLSGIPEERADVLYLGRQEKFKKNPKEETVKILRESFPGINLASCPYVLHVSNNNWYKNRLGLVRIYSQLLKSRPQSPLLVMAGAPLPSEIKNEIQRLGIGDKIISLSSLSDTELCCLYNQAEFLLFPSFEEGFGWPILEAFSCGCRVVTSGRSSMRELGGEAAYYADPYRPDTFLMVVQEVLDEHEETKVARIKDGFLQVEKFSNAKMKEDYLKLYLRILCVKK